MSTQSYQEKLSEREKDLEDRNEELEAQHEELTAAVEALIKKNEVLETAINDLNTRNKEIEQIVYRSYHDLKTPITALEGLIMLLEADPSDKKVYLAKSRYSLSEMKYRLKLLARYSSSLVEEVKTEPVDMALLWEEVLDDLEHVAGFDTMRFTFTKSGMKVLTDPERIKLLLYNIVKNAIEFRSENPRVDVAIQVKKECLKIQVGDNGRGIAAEVQPQVFDMFYRGDTRSQGSGLGLYLCKRAVERLSGRINLVSSLDIGTTVTVELPIKKADN